MGLLSRGTPLDWATSRQYHDYIKHHGILQFLHIYRQCVLREDDRFLWGDEVEHMLIRLAPDARTAKLSLRAPDVLQQLEDAMKEGAQQQPQPPAAHPSTWNASFVPEYGRFMVEATPAQPYGGHTADLLMVEPNMRLRRSMIQTFLLPNEHLMTLTSFPLMGAGDYSDPSVTPHGHVARSLYISDTIIGPHPRFATLTRNIRMRRGGAPVVVRVPLFQDQHTQAALSKQMQLREAATSAAATAAAATRAEPSTSTDSTAPAPPVLALTDPSTGNEMFASLPPSLTHRPIDERREIHMDAMAFGMGCCCLQVTFQTRSLREARHLYDHLAVLAPIMLTLTAASPFFRGRVADIDCRWTVISQSVDDRTPYERGESDDPTAHATTTIDNTPVAPPSETNRVASNPTPTRTPQRLHKSRYDSISSYLSLESDFRAAYNDVPCEIDQQSCDTLVSNGIDELLARHIAHLFARDPLVVYDESVVLDDTTHSDHFENLQSTNWQTVRFKPPPPNSTSMGWRVEFRSMEVQITDRENAAFTVFIALVSRAILYFNLNLYLPLSKVDANMQRAHTRDAVHREAFYWRKSVTRCDEAPTVAAAVEDEYEEMTIAEIMLGKGAVGSSAASSSSASSFGLIPLVRTYLDMIQCDAPTRKVVDDYLDLIERRARGTLDTTATFFRKFVHAHPAYAHDSMLNHEVVYDLLRTCQKLQDGVIQVPALLGQRLHRPEVDAISLGGATNSAAAAAPSATNATSPELASVRPALVLEEMCCERFREFMATL